MSRFCQHCGQAAHDGDRYCIGCGEEVNRAPAAAAAAAFRSPSDPRRRAGGFVVRHARVLMAVAAIALIVGIAVFSNSRGSPAPQKDDAAPAAAVAAEADNVANTAKQNQGADSTHKAVTATDAHGRTFSCAYAVLDQIDVSDGRAKRRGQILDALQAELAKIDKQYPGRTAPAAIADRYNSLAARARAQLKWTNKAVREYNRSLVDLCDAS
jgi:hypothetical protein